MKQRVALFGASGTMGFEAFKELWKRRDACDISILVLPSEQRLDRFRPYEREAGMPRLAGPGIAEGRGFRIVWGDATRYEDVAETIRGAGAVLNAMACISPMADYRPELARAVNDDAVGHILRAIAAEPDGAERIRYIHTGTVAATGNRPVGIHVGRVGDPLNPSVFDYYAITKIAGERRVLESSLRRWACLRMTFIMPTTHRELFGLNDAIMFHMPLDARMENVTDRDAGYGLVNCLDVPDGSDFWRRVYNMGGGPAMRMTAYDFLSATYRYNGLRLEACAERNWFALRNFHMQYYEDSALTDGYLHYWRDTFETWQEALAASRPLGMSLLAGLARRVPAVRQISERAVYAMHRKVAEGHRNSPRYWYAARNDRRMAAFFEGYERYETIPPWGERMPDLSRHAPFRRLYHGYDESQSQLALYDLRNAARFRGGACLAAGWDGDVYAPVAWECAFGHRFDGRPYTVLKAGHWCPICVSRWNGDEVARRSPFFAQVWCADHGPGEDNEYPADCVEDIRDADQDRIAAHRTAIIQG